MDYTELHHVFAGFHYYPSGGVNDHQFSGTLEECIDFMLGKNYDWYQITDITLEIIRKG